LLSLLGSGSVVALRCGTISLASPSITHGSRVGLTFLPHVRGNYGSFIILREACI
jgi:hypothetical protein